MTSTRATRRNTIAAEQLRLEEIELNRRNNRDGSTAGHEGSEREEEVGGQQEPRGGDDGHVPSRDEIEALRAENRRLRHLTGELQSDESRENFSDYPGEDDLVEDFIDFEKHAKVSSAGKAVSEPGFKKLVGVTNYERWKKSFQTIAEIHNL